jgi:zinc/manganese transport system permease protein
MIIVAIHSYLGLHVIAREVIFVDLALAQMAALGSTVAILAGVHPESPWSFAYALGFTTVGAALFALTRNSPQGKSRVPHEAIIGIVFVVASAAAILVADQSPRGGEAIKDILVGSLLWVTWPVIARLAVVYAVIGAVHYALRHRFMTISFDPVRAEREGWSIRWWDFWFYLLRTGHHLLGADRGGAAGLLLPGGPRSHRLHLHRKSPAAPRDRLGRRCGGLRRWHRHFIPL